LSRLLLGTGYGSAAQTNQVPSTNWFNRCRHIIWTEL